MADIECVGCGMIYEAEIAVDSGVTNIGLCPECREALEIGRRKPEECKHYDGIDEGYHTCHNCGRDCDLACPCAAWLKK